MVGAGLPKGLRSIGAASPIPNERFRIEWLNINWLLSMKHVRKVIEDWRRDYIEVRPHSALKDLTPPEYADATTAL
ncbi:MAG: transposase [Chloroflexi bacterium]|nr:transposase [Chloroflexota bacterium]